MRNKTPVAFFAYNRPMHTLRALDALAKCRKIEDCELYLFSDGPRTDAARSGVEETRVILHRWAKGFDAHVVEQPCNLGLAKSIVTGVSDLCAKYGRVIVVEDDLVVSSDFLHYMIQSLDHYENEAQVMQIGGFTLSAPQAITTDVFLLPITTTWGWATWQRAWKNFSWEPIGLDALRIDKDWRSRFDLNGSCAYFSMLEDRLAGRNDSWGILWWYAVSRLKGLVVYPAQSLVWNGGFDGSGIHCGSDDFLQQEDVLSYSRSAFSGSISFPSTKTFESAHMSQLEGFFRSMQASGQSNQRSTDPITRLKVMTRKIKEKLGNAFF